MYCRIGHKRLSWVHQLITLWKDGGMKSGIIISRNGCILFRLVVDGKSPTCSIQKICKNQSCENMVLKKGKLCLDDYSNECPYF